MPYLRVQVTGLTAVYADANGNWTVPYGGTDARTVTADLYSPYVDLNNIAGAEGDLHRHGHARERRSPSPSPTPNAQKDEKDVYRAVNDVHDFFQGFDPTFGYTNAADHGQRQPQLHLQRLLGRDDQLLLAGRRLRQHRRDHGRRPARVRPRHHRTHILGGQGDAGDRRGELGHHLATS